MSERSMLDVDRERVTCLLLINTQLMKKTINLYSNLLTNQQMLQQIPPQNKQTIMESYQNCTRRIHCNLSVLTFINEKYHADANHQSPPNRPQFPVIMSAPPDMPELNQLYTKLQELYPEALQFLKMKIQQLRKSQGQFPNQSPQQMGTPQQQQQQSLPPQRPTSQQHAQHTPQQQQMMMNTQPVFKNNNNDASFNGGNGINGVNGMNGINGTNSSMFDNNMVSQQPIQQQAPIQMNNVSPSSLLQMDNQNSNANQNGGGMLDFF
ncbi:hypothetical protein CAAN1_10S00958 [[Candida] anglica]|uniref:Mediator complex subunit 29 n=1 Tax=[Candida] anglica TaxID=148631 RepID=A0ABP0EFH1_9ASCO